MTELRARLQKQESIGKEKGKRNIKSGKKHISPHLIDKQKTARGNGQGNSFQ